jgi:hypothetical protein
MSQQPGGTGPGLVVPVQVQALVVGAAGSAPQATRRWRFNYPALASFDSPEPEAGAGQSSTQPRRPGVYLHWSLPDALRHGSGDTALSAISYPLVPNRWLVVRLSGTTSRTATGWVVESDCPNTDSPTLYLVDQHILDAWTASGDKIRVDGAAAVRRSAAGGPLVALLGRAFPLAAGWQERAAGTAFLTAVAPGNVLFSSYEPHCANVFTFYDDMTGVSAGDSVSYLIAGWYASPAQDILAGAAPPALGWSVAGAPDARPTTGLYHGLALGVPWQPGQTPASPLPALAGTVHVGLGATTIDAFTALVAGQVGDPGAVDLLRAFQYGLLPSLEAVNGADLLATAVHQAGFASRPGGLGWEIVAASSGVGGDGTGGDGAGGDVELTPQEAAWLAALNVAQAALDAAQATLDAHRWALYALWWKWQKGLQQLIPPDGFDAGACQHAVTAVLPGLITADAQAVAAQLPGVPQPVVLPGDTRQQSFERGVAQFAAARGLGPGKVLKAVAGSRSWRTADPVLVLSGVEPAAVPDPSAVLACRLDTGLVTTLQVGGTPVGAAQLASALPQLPSTTGLPGPVQNLLLEAFLLDPASAPAIAAAAGLPTAAVSSAIAGHPAASYPGEVLPAAGLDRWTQQPWSPLLMEWQVGFVPIPDQAGQPPSWQFDGRDYRFTGAFGPFPADPDAPVEVLGGISPLTPEAQFTFRSQLRQFLTTYVAGDAPADLAALAALERAIDTVDSWRFMSQALTGLSDLVALRDSRSQTGPDKDVAAAVAGQTAGVPYIPNGPAYPFNAVRQGQMAIRLLLVYDTFGQVLQVVGGTGTTDPQNFIPALDAALVPEKPVITRNPARLAELRPRLAQHSRLDFTLVDAVHDETPVLPGTPASPVVAWLLPNHLDNGLLLYGPQGRALGEVRLVTGESGGYTALWQPPPHDPITLADVRAAAPRLADMITAPAFADATAFQAFLDAIDTTLWSIDPLGDRADQNLSVLIGRPLALVRAGLRLTVDGVPAANLADWAVTWPPPEPDFLSRDFAIRLGDLASRQDGLMGFYAGSDYSVFNSVAAPDAGLAQRYVQIIGPVGSAQGNWLTLRYGATGPSYLTLLMDPRAAVHAVSGILPAKTLSLPSRFSRGTLASLELTFRIGSLLTHPEQSPAAGGAPPPYPRSMWLPYPAERNGTWSWWEPAASDLPWAAYGLVRATPQARLKDYPSTLRDGFLQFDTDLSSTGQQPEGAT